MDHGCLCADIECVRAKKFSRALFCVCDIRVQPAWLRSDFETWFKLQDRVLPFGAVTVGEIFCANLVDFGVWWISTQVAQIKSFGTQFVFLADKPVGIVDVD